MRTTHHKVLCGAFTKVTHGALLYNTPIEFRIVHPPLVLKNCTDFMSTASQCLKLWKIPWCCLT